MTLPSVAIPKLDESEQVGSVFLGFAFGICREFCGKLWVCGCVFCGQVISSVSVGGFHLDPQLILCRKNKDVRRKHPSLGKHREPQDL